MSSGADVSLTTRTDDAMVGHDLAVAIGLIVNEFVTNSVRHAFPFGRGTIHIDLGLYGDEKLCLVLADDGVGLPKGTSRRSGRLLIDALVR